MVFKHSFPLVVIGGMSEYILMKVQLDPHLVSEPHLVSMWNQL